MDELERFKAIVHLQEPDYVPIFGFPGAPGMSGGCMEKTFNRLVETGMPAGLGGMSSLSGGTERLDSWHRYWGTTGPLTLDFCLSAGVRGFSEKRWVEGEFEFIESESGAFTRQVLDNDITYSMPEFIVFPVRDRASWAFYKERMTPSGIMPPAEMEENCRRFDQRSQPLAIGIGGPYSFVRTLMGPANASYAFYDDPELVHDMLSWHLQQARTYIFPLIERLRPEVVYMGEDLCYNHGLLISPRQFDAFSGPFYRTVCETAFGCDADIVAVDTDGNLMEYVGLAASYGVNAFFPCEVKAGNDLFALRERFPRLVFFGWLEKESVNEGNEALIEPEILGKVPRLLEKGGYFPNGDHGIQPLVTFPNLCRFMTLLHEVTGNPEGEFPRVSL